MVNEATFHLGEKESFLKTISSFFREYAKNLQEVLSGDQMDQTGENLQENQIKEELRQVLWELSSLKEDLELFAGAEEKTQSIKEKIENLEQKKAEIYIHLEKIGILVPTTVADVINGNFVDWLMAS